MPRTAKIFFHGGLHFITTSVEDGLMLPPNPLINEILKKCLARAQKLHPVDCSHLTALATHVHFFLRVIDPQDTADFMERFKTESAHAINRLLGRKKKTLWCEGYDSPLIVDIETAMDKIAYIYHNPSKDGLTDSADVYPGLSTFSLFKKCTTARANPVQEVTTYQIARDEIQPINASRVLLEVDYARLRRQLIHKKAKSTFRIDLNSWMKRFEIEDPREQAAINRKILDDVRYREAESRAARLAEKKTVIGRKRLIATPIGAPYTPERTGRRMLVHSVHRDLRREIIEWMRNLLADGREVLERWRAGDTTAPYPLGLFPPTGVRLAEPVGW